MHTRIFARLNRERALRAGKLLAVMVIAAFLCPFSSFAQCTSTWNGGTGAWETAGNWTPTGAPGGSSNTCINAASSSVAINAGDATNNLTLGLSTDSLTLNNGTSLTISAGGNISNAGQILLNSGGSDTELIIAGATTLSGSGTLTMSNNPNNFIFGGGTLTNQSTIQGAGDIGNGDLTLVNSGIINANQSNALTINPNGGTTNSGTLEATAGGTLVLLTDGVNNSTGTILASGSGSSVQIDGATVTGGTLTTTSGGTIYSFAGALNGVTLSSGSTLDVTNGNTLTFAAGTITNNGTLNLLSGGSDTELLIGGSTTLSGTGIVTMSNNPNNFIFGGGTLTNKETIQGAGVIGNGNLTLVNNGTIDANQSNALTISPNGGTTNTGTMEATVGGTLVFSGSSVSNAGGTILATGTGSSVQLNGVTINGGTLTSNSGGLIFSNGGALNGATLSTGSTLDVNNGQTLLFDTGTITNNGIINLLSGGSDTELLLTGNVSLTGAGNVVLSDNPNNFIFSSGGTFTLTNVNNTISGSGNIGDGNMAFVNDAGGIVNATSKGGNTLLINTSSFGTTNLGLMEASSGGTLEFYNTAVTNTGGTIEAQSGGTVILNAADVIGGTLTTVGTGTIIGEGNALLDGTSTHPVTLTSGSNLLIQNGNVMLAQGTFTNNGTLNLQSGGSDTELQVGPSGSLTLAGSGTVTLSNNPNNFIFGSSSASVLTNQQTIQGAGDIGDNSLTFVNSGTVNANQSNALTINPNGGTTNTGTLEATAGGTLVLSTYGVNNTGGTILATGTGSSVQLVSSTVTGGTLTTTSGGTIYSFAGTLNGVTLSSGSTLDVTNGNILTFAAGTITNNGTLNLQSGGSDTELLIGGSTTLSGTGTLTMSNATNNFIFGGGTFTNKETIQGAGDIGNQDLTFVNSGTVNANQSNALTINPNGGTTNTGTLEASAGGTLVFSSTGVTNTGGTILATGTGSSVQVVSSTITGGTLTTTSGGTIYSFAADLNGVTLSKGSTLDVTNGNTLSLSTGTITNNGTINLQSGGSDTELNVSGNTVLAGSGKLIFSNNPNNFILGSGTLTNESTIEGAGNIGDGQTTVVNQGTIMATSTSNTLVIDTGGSGFTNNNGAKNGTLSVAAKATLDIIGGPFNNFNGTTDTLTGGIYNVTGTLEFAGANIVTNAASITLTGTSAKILNNANSANALSGFTTNAAKGSFTVNGGTFTDANSFTNDGTLAVGTGGKFDATTALTNFNSTTSTLTGGTYTLTGTGQLQFNNGGDSSDIVTNDAHITLAGATTKASIIDQSGNNALANLDANAAGGNLTLTTDRNFSTAGAFANAGIVDVQKSTGSGTTLLTIGGLYTQTAGTTTVDGKLSATGIDITGGSVFGNNGTLTGNFDLTGGTISPGDSLKQIGVLDISGSYTESGSGILNIGLDGTTADTKYDVLNVSGAASLSGTLDVTDFSGFALAAGDTFDILNYASETGTFSTLNLPSLPTGDTWKVTYGATALTITVQGTAALQPATGSTPLIRGSRKFNGVSALLPSNNLATLETARSLTLSHSSSAILSPASSCGARATFWGPCIEKPASKISNVLEADNNATRSSSRIENHVEAGSMMPRISGGGRAPHTPTVSTMSTVMLYFCTNMPAELAKAAGCR